jgi:hypothetical protein
METSSSRPVYVLFYLDKIGKKKFIDVTRRAFPSFPFSEHSHFFFSLSLFHSIGCYSLFHHHLFYRVGLETQHTLSVFSFFSLLSSTLFSQLDRHSKTRRKTKEEQCQSIEYPIYLHRFRMKLLNNDHSVDRLLSFSFQISV